MGHLEVVRAFRGAHTEHQINFLNAASLNTNHSLDQPKRAERCDFFPEREASSSPEFIKPRLNESYLKFIILIYKLSNQ